MSPAAPADPPPADEAPHDLQAELTREVGATRGARLERRLRDAAKAYERERYGEARQILRALADEAPALRQRARAAGAHVVPTRAVARCRP